MGAPSSTPFGEWPDYIKVTLGSSWATGDTPNPGEDLNEGDVVVLKRRTDLWSQQKYSEDGTGTAGDKNRIQVTAEFCVSSWNVSYQAGCVTFVVSAANPNLGSIGYEGGWWNASGTGWTTEGATGLSWPLGGGLAATSANDPWWTILSYASTWSTWTRSFGAWSTASFLTQRTTQAPPGYSQNGGVFSAIAEATEEEWNEAQGLGGPPIGGLMLMGAGR